MIIDLRQPVNESHDLDQLRGILEALIGQPCVKIALSYGGELTVHLGRPVPYEHPKMAGQVKGSWVLGTRGSRCRLLLANPGLIIVYGFLHESERPAPTITAEQIEKAAASLAGAWVDAAYPVWPAPYLPPSFGYGIFLRFNDGSNLVVIPDNEPGGEGEEPLPDWELFTPYHTYLRSGPGQVWSYVRSNGAVNGTR